MTQAALDAADPSGIAARVAGQAITVRAFHHLLSSELNSEPASRRLAPPDFAACIRYHKTAPVFTGDSSTHPSIAALRAQCESRYQALRQNVLDELITAVWVLDGARELGVDATRGEVERVVHQSQYTSAEAHEYLDAEAIRRAIKRRVGPMTASRIERYYEAHKALYLVPQLRDLRIIRTRTKTEAMVTRRELASGKSFASVVRAISAREPGLQQPFFSKEGLVLALKSGLYNEKPLNDAIFKARRGVLIGPVVVVLGFPGYFLFEVTKIVPAHQKSLRQVATSLRSELPERLYQQALRSFISRWRAKWRARTDCSRGFVVLKCKQFKASGAADQEDPYTLK